MKKDGVLLGMLFALSTLTGCAVGKVYFISRPTESAKLIQTFSLANFVEEIEKQEKEPEPASTISTDSTFVMTANPWPIDLRALAKLRSHAQGGDMVLVYEDGWLDLVITYFCLQRDGKIVWTYKVVEPRRETLANQVPEPMPVLRTVMAHR